MESAVMVAAKADLGRSGDVLASFRYSSRGIDGVDVGVQHGRRLDRLYR